MTRNKPLGRSLSVMLAPGTDAQQTFIYIPTISEIQV